MSTTKAKRIALVDLSKDQVVWSDRWNTYVKYVGKDFEGEHIFEFLHKKSFCVIIETCVYEPPELIKELL
jgi:hypothetical protein